jgi:phytoene dehydrogenase-like protein
LRYDAAIIGAGAEGLAAAVTLARSGLKVIVIERNERPGGRHVTREFHPGFHASPFCDGCTIPSQAFRDLDLARHGVLLWPATPASALWPDRAQVAVSYRARAEAMRIVSAAQLRAATDTTPQRRSLFGRRKFPAPAPWPGASLATRPLREVLSALSPSDDMLALMLSDALEGRAAHPDRTASALHMLAAAAPQMVAGGLQSLTDALMAAALGLGVEVSCGLDAVDIRCRRGRTDSVRLADGADVAARAVISTLDFKRTFLSLFAWNDLPGELAGRAATFRMSGATARLLFALDGLPEIPSFADARVFAGAIHVAPKEDRFGNAFAAWHSGTLAEQFPMTIRFPSAADPRLCPAGTAMMTVTAGCVPSRLFDGAWTNDKRDGLRHAVLQCIEQVLPGVTARIRACEVIVPPDIEQALGCTEGDLWGGEIAADQMFSYRPGGAPAPRTPVEGLYLAGPSTMAGVLGTCASGIVAAQALMADLKDGRLK